MRTKMKSNNKEKLEEKAVVNEGITEAQRLDDIGEAAQILG